MDQVLRVDIPELPEERYELSPLDRGSLVHETLDAFLREVLDRPGGTPAPDAPWTDADRTRLRELGQAVAATYEAQGLTGRRLFWRRDRRRILADLDRFLTEDSDLRAAHRMQTIATELRFGFTAGSAPPVEIALSDGSGAALPGRRRPRRPVDRRHALGDRLQDRVAVRRRLGRPDGTRHDAAAPGLRPRGARVLRRRHHAGRRVLLVREHQGWLPLGRARAHARG